LRRQPYRADDGGGDSLYFRCRIAHALGLKSLPRRKRTMERCLWVAVTALEELLAPGWDLQRLDGASGKALCAGLRDRVCRLQADAETLRRVAAANRAVVLPVGDERVPRAFGPRAWPASC
jgi:hypothetical protein